MADITFQIGDDNSFDVAVTIDEEGTSLAYDLTNVQAIEFYMKENMEPTLAPVITKMLDDGITVSDPEAGIFIVTLTAEDTALLNSLLDYYIQARITDENGELITVFLGMAAATAAVA
jgi:hypothetical protein